MERFGMRGAHARVEDSEGNARNEGVSSEGWIWEMSLYLYVSKIDVSDEIEMKVPKRSRDAK
jgi:hypothetical protein